MRFALSGSSSTGKTTLARAVVRRRADLRQMSVDARALLKDMGAGSTDQMSPRSYASFQRRYIAAKFWMERGLDAFLAERSFVDAYAYWSENCSADASPRENAQVLRLCRALASVYDRHFFLPYGLIPHEDDGWRHPDPEYHQAISARIESLLREWQLPHEVIEQVALDERVEQVLRGVSGP